MVNIWIGTWQRLVLDIGGLAPRLLAALVVMAAGLAGAWMVKWMVGLFFRVLKLDARFSGLWLFRLWRRRLQGRGPADIMANFAYYFALFLALLLAIRVLGLEAGQIILSSLVGVMPRVFSFVLILSLGSLLAMFFSVLAQMALAASGSRHPGFWGKIVAWVTFSVTVIFSLEPLGFAGQFVTIAVLILLGSAALAAALALGLGCKDLAREFIIEMLKENRPGD